MDQNNILSSRQLNLNQNQEDVQDIPFTEQQLYEFAIQYKQQQNNRHQYKQNPRSQQLIDYESNHEQDAINTYIEKNQKSPENDRRRKGIKHASFVKYKGWNFVKLLGKVKMFMDKLKANRKGQSFQLCNKQHFMKIKDLTYIILDDNYEQLTGIDLILLRMQKKMQMYLDFLSHIPVIHTDSFILNIWKLIVLIMVVFQIFLVPMKISFNITDRYEQEWFQQINFETPLIIFLLDIIISFNTTYYEEGGVILDRKKIIKKYIKQNFILESFTALILLINHAYHIQYLELLFLLRIHQMLDITKNIQENWQLQQKIPTMQFIILYYKSWTLSSLVFMIIILAHFCGCGFHLIGTIYFNDGRNWLNDNNLQDSQIFTKYLYSLYFSIITMITVGYGDIKPISEQEMIYVIFITIISSGIFAYSVNTVGQIFTEQSQKEAKFKIKKYEMNNYMKKRQISYSIQVQVRKYLDYMQEKENQDPTKGINILNTVSKKIKNDVYKDFFCRILNQIKVLKFNFSKQFIEELSLQMNEIVYGPGEIIFSKGDIDNRLFFIQKGEIEFFLQQGDNNQEYLNYDIKKKKESFGETNFFTCLEQIFTCRAINMSHLLYITNEDFIQIVKKYPKDYEKYCQIKDQILLEEEKLNVRCSCCKINGQQKYGHSIIDCPYLHFVRNKLAHIQKHNSNIVQERKQKSTRMCVNFNARKQKYIISQNLKIFRDKISKIMQNHNVIKLTYNLCDKLSEIETDPDQENSDSIFYYKQPFCLKYKENGNLEIDSDNSIQNKIIQPITDESENNEQNKSDQSSQLSDVSSDENQNESDNNQFDKQNQKQIKISIKQEQNQPKQSFQTEIVQIKSILNTNISNQPNKQQLSLDSFSSDENVIVEQNKQTQSKLLNFNLKIKPKTMNTKFQNSLKEQDNFLEDILDLQDQKNFNNQNSDIQNDDQEQFKQFQKNKQYFNNKNVPQININSQSYQFNPRKSIESLSFLTMDQILQTNTLQQPRKLGYKNSVDIYPIQNNQTLLHCDAPFQRKQKNNKSLTIICANDPSPKKQFKQKASLSKNFNQNTFKQIQEISIPKKESIYKKTQDKEKDQNLEQFTNKCQKIQQQQSFIQNLDSIYQDLKQQVNILQGITQNNQVQNQQEIKIKENDTLTNSEDQKQHLFIYDFDEMKCFQNYYPSGNYQIVLEKIRIINQNIKKKYKEVQKKKNLFKKYSNQIIKKNIYQRLSVNNFMQQIDEKEDLSERSNQSYRKNSGQNSGQLKNFKLKNDSVITNNKNCTVVTGIKDQIQETILNERKKSIKNENRASQNYQLLRHHQIN